MRTFCVGLLCGLCRRSPQCRRRRGRQSSPAGMCMLLIQWEICEPSSNLPDNLLRRRCFGWSRERRCPLRYDPALARGERVDGHTQTCLGGSKTSVRHVQGSIVGVNYRNREKWLGRTGCIPLVCSIRDPNGECRVINQTWENKNE